MRFFLCFVTGIAVVLLHSRVSLAQSASDEPAAIEITASASEAVEAPRWRARAVLDTERAPSSAMPTRRVHIGEHPRDPTEHGPQLGMLCGGTAILVLAQLFPFIVAASGGNYWFAIPVVPEVIDGARLASSGGLAPIGASVEFGLAGLQAAGLALSVVGSVLREHGEAPRENSRSIFSWYVAPHVSRSSLGLAVAVMNW